MAIQEFENTNQVVIDLFGVPGTYIIDIKTNNSYPKVAKCN